MLIQRCTKYDVSPLRRQYLIMKHNATKIQAYVRMKIQEKKYTISLQEEKIQADMAYQLRLLQERLQEEQKRNLSLELDREQEDQVFPTMSDSNSSRGKVSFVPPPRVRKKSSAHLVMADAGGMIERMQEENAKERDRANARILLLETILDKLLQEMS